MLLPSFLIKQDSCNLGTRSISPLCIIVFIEGEKPWQASGSCRTILQGWGWWGMPCPWIMSNLTEVY